MKSLIQLLLTTCLLFSLSTCKKNEAAASCSDGKQNQNETGIDCGGECSVCITCSDGIQNQGETDIDCGGPCNACDVTFPAKGKYGPNILRLDTITIKGSIQSTITPMHYYSICANLSSSGALKVRFTTMGSGNPCNFTINSSTKENWIPTTNVFPGFKEYTAIPNSNCDLQIYFCGTEPIKVEYFLNGSSTPYRTKILSLTI
ncbi:MAG: hypothetical protein IT236_17375 [Bacteroidia bacterium]|nr:hypothetical protein [Bacteroidia bacterium]